MRVVVIIPTYNEVENVGRLVPILADIFRGIPAHEWLALFVDGNSTDGTGEKLMELAMHHSFVKVLVEEKKAGLGAAYVNGFRLAMKEYNPDVLIEMDADFQHDPLTLPSMVGSIEHGADYVVASRFIKGGGIPSGWAIHRKAVSVLGNIFAKVVLGVFTVTDFTSGFKASRVRGFVDKLDFSNLLSGGFAYKMDLLFRMHKLGAKIVEVPLKFGLRDRGDSKMERNNLWDSLRVVLLLRFHESRSFIIFCVVGFIGLFVDTALFNLLRITLFRSNVSAVISGLIAMLTTFCLNNYWSFSDRKIQSNLGKVIGFVVYIVSSFVPILGRSEIVKFATAHFGDTWLVSNIAFGIGIIIGLIWNFTVYSKVIWRKK